MILTEEQKIIRELFRKRIVELWNSDKQLMFNIIDYIADGYVELSRDEVKEKMAAIPSIGRFRENMPIHAFVARHFRPVSDALFSGCSLEKALEIWKNTKRAKHPEKKRTKEELGEYRKHRRNLNKLSAIAELKSNLPSRYEKTNWNKCK